MALVLRLQRRGRKSRPFYHIVAADIRSPRNGRFKEKIGYYVPTSEPSTVVIDATKLHYYYSRGAKLSNTVRNLAKLKNISLSRDASPPATQPDTPSTETG